MSLKKTTFEFALQQELVLFSSDMPKTYKVIYVHIP